MPLIKYSLLVVLITTSLSSFAQEVKQPSQTVKAVPTYIETSQVPAIIIEKHNKEYPLRTLEVWNGYPEFIDESDWYGCNPFLFNCLNPKYYVVDFTHNNRHHKVIYTLEGKKVATHVSMNKKTIKAIAKAILYSKYKDWKVTSAYEEVFKGESKDLLIVYKIEVTKGSNIHYLFYKANGILIKDKEIK